MEKNALSNTFFQTYRKCTGGSLNYSRFLKPYFFIFLQIINIKKEILDDEYFLLSIYESNLNKPEKEYLLILIEMLYNERENLKQFESHYKSSDQVVRINAMDEFIQKSIANGRNHDTEMANQIYDFISTPTSHEDEMNKNPDLIEQRKEFRRKIKKYVKPGNHVNVNELEADQYAANKVGTETMIRALHSMNKLDKVYAEIDIRNETENEKNSETYKN